MYLHETILVPLPVLQAIAAYLEERPYKEAAPLLQSLHGLPNGTAEGMETAKILIAEVEIEPIKNYLTWFEPEATGTTLPTPGENTVDFPAGVGRRE